MNPIDIARSSGGQDVQIPTLELTSTAWDSSVFICGGFFNQTFTTEDGRTVVFEAAGIDVSLPKRGNIGSQSLGIAIDNVRGEAQRLLDIATSISAKVTLIYRLYLDSDHSNPCERPLRMTVLSFQAKDTTVELQAGYLDLISLAWPRDRYTADFAPGIKYIS